MTIVKDTLKRTFVYTRIANHLVEKIASGELAPGSFLLSERKLAEMYNVNHATARKATQLLVDKGLVRKIHGQGILVADNQKRKKTTKFIGFILCKRKKSSPFYFEIINCVEEELKKFGFHLVFSNFNDSSTEIPRMLKNSAVDGVIITGEVPPHLLNFLQKNKISHVLMAHSIKYDGKSDIVASDERDIGYKAANYLLKKHRRLALIRGGESFRPHDVLRGDGFIQALAEYGRKFDAGMLVECNSYDPAEIRKKISTLLKKDRPDAIFATNINFLNEAVPVFCNSGIRIPEDLEFVIFSGPGTLRLNIPEPVVVKTDSKEISRAAVNRLLDMICGRAVGISINLIPAVLSKNVFLNNKQL